MRAKAGKKSALRSSGASSQLSPSTGKLLPASNDRIP
jgi:hypothetical protein